MDSWETPIFDSSELKLNEVWGSLYLSISITVYYWVEPLSSLHSILVANLNVFEWSIEALLNQRQTLIILLTPYLKTIIDLLYNNHPHSPFQKLSRKMEGEPKDRTYTSLNALAKMFATKLSIRQLKPARLNSGISVPLSSLRLSRELLRWSY